MSNAKSIVSRYRSISDPQKVAAYAKLSRPALAPFGARCPAIGNATAAYEHGLKERIVIIEFPSVEKAIAARESTAYGEALKASKRRCNACAPDRPMDLARPADQQRSTPSPVRPAH
jgi:uncharacterized protein (DUF1330 family)